MAGDLRADDPVQPGPEREVLSLLNDGSLTPQIAARLPLTAAGQAMELAESHTAYGKIVLIP